MADPVVPLCQELLCISRTVVMPLQCYQNFLDIQKQIKKTMPVTGIVTEWHSCNVHCCPGPQFIDSDSDPMRKNESQVCGQQYQKAEWCIWCLPALMTVLLGHGASPLAVTNNRLPGCTMDFLCCHILEEAECLSLNMVFPIPVFRAKLFCLL